MFLHFTFAYSLPSIHRELEVLAPLVMYLRFPGSTLMSSTLKVPQAIVRLCWNSSTKVDADSDYACVRAVS
jgi:hypothetical protein